MINCKFCGNECPDGSQFCDECGNSLKESLPAAVSESENSAVISASSTSIGIPFVGVSDDLKDDFASPQIVESNSSQSQNARLVIERGIEIGKEFHLSTDESYIGRWDADNGIFPDIDLDKYDPEAKISRRHARIFFEKDKFLIEDMGSTNGTFVNRGRRLLPGTPHILNDNDEIIIGKTFLRFNIS